MSTDIRAQLDLALGNAYTIERERGGGGMSHVYLATEQALGRQVVVKVLPAEMLGQVSVERFKREIALAAQLQHPHIVPQLSAGEAGDLPYFTMPRIESESLRARLSRHGELPAIEAVRVLRKIASALAYAHDRGVVHRDIKQDNVLMSGGIGGIAIDTALGCDARHDRPQDRIIQSRTLRADRRVAAAFKGSAIKRATLWVLRRNACVVRGNVGTPDDLAVLEAMRSDEHQVVCEHAAWALGQIGDHDNACSRIDVTGLSGSGEHA